MALGPAGSLLSNFFLKPAGGMNYLPAGSAPEPIPTSGLYATDSSTVKQLSTSALAHSLVLLSNADV